MITLLLKIYDASNSMSPIDVLKSNVTLILNNSKPHNPIECLQIYKENLNIIFSGRFESNEHIIMPPECSKIYDRNSDYVRESMMDCLKKYMGNDTIIYDDKLKPNLTTIFKYFNDNFDNFIFSDYIETNYLDCDLTECLNENGMKLIKETFKYNMMINFPIFYSGEPDLKKLEVAFYKNFINIYHLGMSKLKGTDTMCLRLLRNFLKTLFGLGYVNGFKTEGIDGIFLSITSIVSEISILNDCDSNTLGLNDAFKTFQNSNYIYDEDNITKETLINKILSLKAYFSMKKYDNTISPSEIVYKKIRTLILLDILVNVLDIIQHDGDERMEVEMNIVYSLTNNLFLYSLNWLYLKENFDNYFINDLNSVVIYEINNDQNRNILSKEFKIDNDEILTRHLPSNNDRDIVSKIRGKLKLSNDGNMKPDDERELTDDEIAEKEWALDYVKNDRTDDFLDYYPITNCSSYKKFKKKYYYNLFRLKINKLIHKKVLETKIYKINASDPSNINLLLILEILEIISGNIDSYYIKAFYETVNIANMMNRNNELNALICNLSENNRLLIFFIDRYKNIMNNIIDQKSIDAIGRLKSSESKITDESFNNIFYVCILLFVILLVLGHMIYRTMKKQNTFSKLRTKRR